MEATLEILLTVMLLKTSMERFTLPLKNASIPKCYV